VSIVDRTWITQATQSLSSEAHIGIVHAHARLAPTRLLVLHTQHARRVHGTTNVGRQALGDLWEGGTVQGRQSAPLWRVGQGSRAEVCRIVGGVARRGIGEVESLDAGQTSVLVVGRRVGGDRGQVEGLGVMLEIGGRRWALLLLHGRGEGPPKRARNGQWKRRRRRSRSQNPPAAHSWEFEGSGW
jgi:hypothetical protein